MATGAYSGTKLLLCANRARFKPDVASPFRLWQLADSASTGQSDRALLFRHAMIHAGYLLDGDGEPYATCRVCEEPLA